MTERQSYLVVGSGIAGAIAVELLRAEEPDAEVAVIADDPFPVYYRPALKDYLGGKLREDKLWARPMRFYEDRRVRFINDAVVDIRPQQHTVQLRSGHTVGYSRLLLAQGARPVDLRCPGRQFSGVSMLRTVADYQNVLRLLGSVRRVVVVGGGTLALETIETLRHRDYQVTHLIRGRTLWSDVLDATASDLVLQQERRDGVDVRVEQEITEIIGNNGQVAWILTKQGVHIPCEMVILAIGIEPILDFVKSTGIKCNRGILVDSAMQTSIPDIYAAGDVLETTNPLTGGTRVLGQWYPAIQQARAAAYSMLDRLDTQQVFQFGNFYNATFLYGLDFASVGMTTLPKDARGYQELVADPQPRIYQKVIVRNGVPVGALTVGDRKKALALKRAIDHQVNLSSVALRLFAPDFSLDAWLNTQGVPAPILSVSRQGAVAVKRATSAEKGFSINSSALAEAVLIPSTQGQEVYMSKIKVVQIGRQDGSDLVLNNNSISRRHAEISYANGQYVLRDLDSMNGTHINGTRIAKGSLTILKNGDTLRFGTMNDVSYTVKIRQIDAASSLLGKRLNIGQQEPSAQEHTSTLSIPQTLSHQPVFLADGTLSLPGVTEAIAAPVVAQFKTTPTLIVLLQGQAHIFPLSPDRHVVLGRIPECTIQVNDMSVSRKHAEVFSGPDGMYIRDLHSSNGVSVNQTKIDNPYRLSTSDRILLGNVPIYFFDHRREESNGQQAAFPALANNARRMPDAAEPASPLSAQQKSCSRCGYVNSSVARFCARCGAPQ